MKNSNYKVQVLINDKPIRQFAHEGNFWVEARKGATYEVKIKNNSWKRVLAVVSIDGLDVLSGASADEKSGGYIIPPFQSYTVRGFRTSKDEVSLFEFSDKEKSYAVNSPSGESSSKNCGGIGITIIEEKEKPRPEIIYRDRPVYIREPLTPRWPKYDTTWYSGDPEGVSMRSMSMMKGGNTRGVTMNDLSSERTYDSASYQKQAVELDMGTKFSDTSVQDKVTYAEFERGRIAEQIAIYYASKEVLKKLGIQVEPEPSVALPQLFKGSFCQPPKRS